MHGKEGDTAMPILFLLLIQNSDEISLGVWLPLLLPLALLELILILVALVDLIRRDPRQVRGSKLAWGLVILLIATLGPICYLLVGRKEEADVHS
jgi:hypothetical protein